MARTTSNSFELVPSVQSRDDMPAPIALLPALPIRLQQQDESNQYAIVDTSAQISTMTSSLAEELGISAAIYSTVLLRERSQNQPAKIVKVDLTICDSTFSPWIRLNGVPFVVRPSSPDWYDPRRIVLGYESCLAHCRLIIDFPRRQLKISAPVELLASGEESNRIVMPSRIVEGENLIELGSYSAAVAIIAAGVEEAIITYLDYPSSGYTLGKLAKELFSRQPIPELDKRLNEIVQFRNRAVHGGSGQSISREEARRVLQDARFIIRKLTEQNSEKRPSKY